MRISDCSSDVCSSDLGISVSGGMFVVPLYAFLTTTVNKSETARTVAANNVVNSGAMTLGAVAILGATGAGLSIAGALLLVAVMCLMSAWLGWKLHRACDLQTYRPAVWPIHLT